MASGKGNPALLTCSGYTVHGYSCQEGSQRWPDLKKIQVQVMGKRQMLLKQYQKMGRAGRMTMSSSSLKARTNSRPAHRHTLSDTLSSILSQLGAGEGLATEL